jgi:acyl dehydratase
MAGTISKEDFLASAGTEYGPGEWMKIDQERINKFAEATGDFQFIHVDPEAAKQTPFGSTIAHGFLSLSLLALLAPQITPKPENVAMGVNYGLNKLRFLNPVKVDQEVRVKTKVLEVVEKRPGQVLVTSEVTLEIKGEKAPALVAEWLGMTFLSDAA